MCGICGWLNLNKKIDSNVMVAMNNVAKYRGPDDEGYVAISDSSFNILSGNDSSHQIEYFTDISKYNSLNYGDFLMLGHRRLSILDLSSNGHQPMTNSDDSLAITYNGEIYNYIEIRENLEKLNYSFATLTDTEVILKAYLEWGEECVQYFDGMWSFAIWDGKNHKLFCSRDRLGAKPFYYSFNGRELLFASEIKQLCQNDSIKRVLNEKNMVTQIMWGISDFSEETLIEDIKSLMGGHNLVIQLDLLNSKIETFKIEKYWDIDVSSKRVDAENEFGSILLDAIHMRTRSDAPIGVLLSGGLDSSCVVSEIADYYEQEGKNRQDLNTFTSCYNDFEEGDEQNYASLVNEFCGTSQNFIYPDARDTLQVYKDLVWHLEGNLEIQEIGGYLFLQEISKRGVKVLINGQGSDETQFGYERYYAWYFKELIKERKLLSFAKAFKEGKMNSGLSAKTLAMYTIYFSFLPIRKMRCYTRMNKYASKRTLKLFKTNTDINRFINQRSMGDLQYNEIRGTQLPHILRMDDRLYMAHSLESRVPFIDYKYVEKAVSIPEGRKIQNGYTKYLLRVLFEKKLPETVVWRKNKMGWPSPRKRWAERFSQEKVYELLNTAKTSKYFNVEEIKKLFSKQPDAYAVEKFLTYELFVRLFDVEIPK